MAGCPEPEGELSLSAIGPIITWLLVLAGWAVVHWTTVRRARRQEELAMLAGIERRVVSLREKAIQYYSSEPGDSDKAVEAQLKFELQSIYRNIALLAKRQPGGYDVEGYKIDFRRAVTGATFESGLRVALAHDDERIQNIWGYSDDLVAALQDCFVNLHRRF